MQQPPRLVYPHGNASGAGHRSGAAPASVPAAPLTPRKKIGEVDRIIRSLEDQYQLGFNVTDELRSPVSRRSTADAAEREIQRLFFKHRPALDEAIAMFKTTAVFMKQDQRANALLTILRQQVPLQMSRSGTPTSSNNVPPNGLKTPQPSDEDITRSRGLFDNYKQDGATLLRAARPPDPGSPTDEDEDNFVTPPPPRGASRSPSPSVTSKSAKRRVEASAHLSLQGTARKRPSDGSNENEKSPKLTKISKDKPPFIKPQVRASSKHAPELFKKPSLEMARSFSVYPSSQSTVNTSFGTLLSSQQTQPDTANTSFTSDADHTEVPHSFFTRTSSTTMDSLQNKNLLAMGVKETLALDAYPEASNNSSQGRDSSSTWGSSIPEEDLLDAFANFESLHATSAFAPSSLSQHQQSAQPAGGSQPSRSPAKNGTFAHTQPDAAALNRSFPPPPGISLSLSPDKAATKPRSLTNSVTPTRPQRQSPREPTPAESPSKIAHHIRDIPRQNLFIAEPDPSLPMIPYFALFILQRVALERSISLAELVHSMDLSSACADPAAFWVSLEKHPKITQIKFKDSAKLWSAGKRDYDGFTFKGQINIRKKQSGPIFQLDLHPILSDKSCRFQRKFGTDRFLYLNVPELDKGWSGGNQEDLALIRARWEEWLLTEHSFLRRKWRVFHIEPLKKPKTAKTKDREVTHGSRIVLFATKGRDLDQNISVGEMLNGFLPFAQNEDQSFCKAYARFDLGLSRTTPTYTFKPSEIRPVSDQLASGDRETTEFDDPDLTWPKVPERLVMNDGCSRISVGAAKAIWKLYKQDCVKGPLPSAFQGRIGGAKGLWMLSGDSFTKDPYHLEIWIEISEKQRKFKLRPEDSSDDTFDPFHFIFEISKFSSSLAHSDLHISFIPIMADRGVPKAAIADHMTQSLDIARSNLLESVKDPVNIHEYIHKNSPTSKEGSDVSWQAGLPIAQEDKMKMLIQGGFSPCRLEFLAKTLLRFVKKQHLRQESKLKTPLGKSTYLYGVADPLGILKPGEVHIQFSSVFEDEVTVTNYSSLKGHNLLVARQPAIRNSDIQKVRAVNKYELSHLVDLVVFPSKGEYPLAGKLQGGDYDGDIFWICWEDTLVEPFRNAPAPVTNPVPERYGIKVDKRTLKDLRLNVNDESSVDGFLKEAFKFRNAPSLLGKVTVYLDKMCYRKNKLSSHQLDPLGDIHDLLVDAPKQGYTFTVQDWEANLRKLGCRRDLGQPIYKEAMDACAAYKGSDDVDGTREKKYRYNKDHIVDYLYFEIVRCHNVATMKELQAVLSTAHEVDADLLYPRLKLRDVEDPIVKQELVQVQSEMDLLYKSWNANTHRDDRAASTHDFGRVVEDLYTQFLAIEPRNVDHPVIKAWLHPWLSPRSRLWDGLRASILYAKFPSAKAQTFVFQMAGDELTKIKADVCKDTRYVVAGIAATMKPRRTRAHVVDDESDEGVDDAAGEEIDDAVDMQRMA